MAHKRMNVLGFCKNLASYLSPSTTNQPKLMVDKDIVKKLKLPKISYPSVAHEEMPVKIFDTNALKSVLENATKTEVTSAGSKRKAPGKAGGSTTKRRRLSDKSTVAKKKGSNRRAVKDNPPMENSAFRKVYTEICSYADAKKLPGETKIPWLVPSCSSTLKHLKSLPGLQKLFKDKNIAALVPGQTNASCDIEAYQ